MNVRKQNNLKTAALIKFWRDQLMRSSTPGSSISWNVACFFFLHLLWITARRFLLLCLQNFLIDTRGFFFFWSSASDVVATWINSWSNCRYLNWNEKKEKKPENSPQFHGKFKCVQRGWAVSTIRGLIFTEEAPSIRPSAQCVWEQTGRTGISPLVKTRLQCTLWQRSGH